MLSLTHTVEDVKKQLKNDYAFYGFADDYEFEDAIILISDDVELRYFVSRLTQTQYDITKAKNKLNLLIGEKYLYWAEVFTICVEFLEWITESETQLQTAKNESLTVEGYSHSESNTGSGAASSASYDSLRYFRGKMVEYFKLAGYDLNALHRTSHIFEDSETATDKLVII